MISFILSIKINCLWIKLRNKKYKYINKNIIFLQIFFILLKKKSVTYLMTMKVIIVHLMDNIVSCYLDLLKTTMGLI